MKILSLEKEKEFYEKQWDQIYQECLDGKIEQLKLFSVMSSLQRVEHLIFKERYDELIKRLFQEHHKMKAGIQV